MQPDCLLSENVLYCWSPVPIFFYLKVFIESGGISANRLLRQEVDILTKLQHPCLISIEGVSLRPRMLLLEHAPLGNLDDTLKSGRGPLSRGMQHRITLQVWTLYIFIPTQKSENSH